MYGGVPATLCAMQNHVRNRAYLVVNMEGTFRVHGGNVKGTSGARQACMHIYIYTYLYIYLYGLYTRRPYIYHGMWGVWGCNI